MPVSAASPAMNEIISAKPAVSLCTGYDVRLACRRGLLYGSTGGLASGHVQGNLVILPNDLAAHFAIYGGLQIRRADRASRGNVLSSSGDYRFEPVPKSEAGSVGTQCRRRYRGRVEEEARLGFERAA
jgi:hypothetical protein